MPYLGDGGPNAGLDHSLFASGIHNSDDIGGVLTWRDDTSALAPFTGTDQHGVRDWRPRAETEVEV